MKNLVVMMVIGMSFAVLAAPPMPPNMAALAVESAQLMTAL